MTALAIVLGLLGLLFVLKGAEVLNEADKLARRVYGAADQPRP